MRPNFLYNNSLSNTNLMQKSQCLGCKTHFAEGQKLPLQGISIELKNYPLPMKQQKHKWNLLKTICSLLNAKGGTIFIGAEDSTGEVKGIVIQRKQQDDFKLFIEQLVSRIQPPVDLYDKQEIIVQFLPVLNNSKFLGKYLIKIGVSQGDPSKLYCFTQKITMQSPNDKKGDDYEIVYSYRRQNMGNIKQLKGIQLVTQAMNKASKPANLYKTFHQSCNPQPSSMTVEIVKIGFSGIANKDTRNMLQKWFDFYLQQLKITQFTIDYDTQNDIVLIDLQAKDQYTKVLSFIDKNLAQLNKNIDGCKFAKSDVFLDCMLYKNETITISSLKQDFGSRKKNKFFIQNDKKQAMIQQQTENSNLSAKPVKKQKEQRKQGTGKSTEKMEKMEKMEKVEKSDKKGKQKIKNNISLTFTHIMPQRKKQFIHFLQNEILNCSKRIASQYDNTVEVFFENDEDFLSYYSLCEGNEDISNFGFKGQIRIGVNTGCLTIYNYDKGKWKVVADYLKKLMGKDLKQIQSMKKGNKYSLVLWMSSKPLACAWLDKLLQDKPFKNFQIPGAQKGNAAKMKIFLQVQRMDFQQIWQA